MKQDVSLELNDNVLFEGLKTNYNPGNTTGQYPLFQRKKEKVGSFYGKKHILEENQSCILSFWTGPRW